jgi:hypothetical protein
MFVVSESVWVLYNILLGASCELHLHRYRGDITGARVYVEGSVKMFVL